MQSRSWIALRSRPEIAFAALLIVLTGGLLLGVGLGANALPFPLQSTFSDAAITHWPNALFFQQSVRAGYWPLWNNLLMSGIPFAADPLSKVWYPPQWLAIILPVTTHLNLMIWLHLILAGLGMRALCRRLGQNDAASSICGLAYAVTPRLLAATGAGHMDIVYVEAWFPWVLWAIDFAISAPVSLRVRAAVVGCIGALSLLADLRISVFSFAFGAAFAFWRTRRAEAGKIKIRGVAAALLIGLVLTVGLTAVQWIPLVALLSSLSRGDLTAQGAAVYSLQLAQLIGLLYPDRFGFHETMVYVGIAVLALAMMGFAQNPRRHLFWLVIMLIAGWYALGDQGILWPALARVIPGVVWLRVPSRAWIVVVVCLIVLAGYGIDTILEGLHAGSKGPLRSGSILIVCGILFGLAAASLPLRPGAGIETALTLLILGSMLMFWRYIPIISLIKTTKDVASNSL
ncbi:MAG TPA: hypothetical protein VKQ72_00400, partial [Aggregatilineales bacterium]|nr:hypothetical protein [Aggregatilineales bacterium]